MTSVPWAVGTLLTVEATGHPEADWQRAPLERGSLNRRLGWTLMVAGFAWAAWLDPWSLLQTDPMLLAPSGRLAVRHAQAVVLSMGLLQLLVARLPLVAGAAALAYRLASRLVAGGAVLYALGYGLSAWRAEGGWLIPLGTLLNLAGLCLLAGIARSGELREVRPMLLVVAFGMLLDGLMALFAVSPDTFRPDYIGPEDGVRQRMLRLARAAAIALPALTLLLGELAGGRGRDGRLARWGRRGLAAGMIAMPLTLTVAALVRLEVRYLLALPAWAIVAGTLVGARLAWVHASRLEWWGWTLAGAGMVAGLFMGAYAFDGPLDPPAFLGAYNDVGRRLSRLAHAYTIVLGLTSIFLARRCDASGASRLARTGRSLFTLGSVVILVAILGLLAGSLPARVLSLGPVIVAGATFWCVVATTGVPRGAEMAACPGGTR